MPAFRDKIAVLSRVVGSQSLIPADVDRSGFSRDYSTETDCSVVKPTPERGVGSHYRTVGRTALQFLRDINKKSRPCKNSWLQNRYGGKNGLFSGTNTGSLTVRYVLLDSVGLLCVSAGLGGVTAVLHRSFRTSRVTISREDSSLSGPVTVALLLQRNVALEWHEAVAVVLEIAEGLERSGRTVLPTYQDLELRPDGSIRFLRDPSRAGESLAKVGRYLSSAAPGRFARTRLGACFWYRSRRARIRIDPRFRRLASPGRAQRSATYSRRGLSSGSRYTPSRRATGLRRTGHGPDSSGADA